MKRGYQGGRDRVGFGGGSPEAGVSPGKRTLTEAIDFGPRPVSSLAPAVQRKAEASAVDSEYDDEEELGEVTAAEEGIRFGDEAVLHDVAAGKKVLGIGDKGQAVIRVQEALHDLRFSVSVHGIFTTDTESVVKQFQNTQGIGETGRVDAATYKALETVFASKKPYAEMAKQTAPGLHAVEGVEWNAASPPTPLDNWARTPSAEDKADVADAMSPAKKTGGASDAFKPEIDGKKYEVRLEALLDAKILDQWERIGKGKADLRKDDAAKKKNLFTLNEAADVGKKSKQATDRVFGSWRVGPKLEAGKNLEDKYEHEDSDIKASSADENLATATWRVEKIVRADADVAKLSAEHNVDRSRAVEEGKIKGCEKKLATKYTDKLLDIQRAWPASADPAKGKVYLQLFKGKTDDGNWAALWRMFMTLVHEYVHTLEHSQWRTWRDAETKKDKSKGQTLLEGVTEFLTRVVLSDVNPKDKELRKGVEGTRYDEDADPPKLERTGYQADADRAEKMAGVVGVSNLYNAYFVGQTQFLGG
jgi:hypothetical protein